MTNSDVFAELALDLQDTQETTYSMYDKVRAVNYILRLVNNFLPKSSPDLKATATLTVSSGQATLPSDFQSLQALYNGDTELLPKPLNVEFDNFNYEIRGTTVYTSAAGPLTCYYKKQLGTLTTSGSAPTGDFPLPVLFVELVKKYAVMYLTNGYGAEMIAKLEADVRKIGSSSDKGRLQRRALWEV